MSLSILVILFVFVSISVFDLTGQAFYQVKDIRPGEYGSGIRGFAVMQDRAYFWATRASGIRQLWTTDGTANGTLHITELPYNHWPKVPVVIADSLLIFISYLDSTGLELFRSDGNLGSESLVLDLTPGSSSSISQFGRGDGTYAYFMSTFGSQGSGLYRTDGTDSGTIRIMGGVGGLTDNFNYKGISYTRIFYQGDTWLLKTDGSVEGTEILTKIQSQMVSTHLGIVSLRDSIYFLKENPDESWGLWRTDGTDSGLTHVVSTNPPGVGSPHSLLASDEQLFFVANDGENGQEIWISDGTASGTDILIDLEPPGSTDAAGFSFIQFRKGILFLRNTVLHGTEIWVSDGTVDGTHLLKDIWPGTGHSKANIRYASVEMDSILYFQAADPEHGVELWRTDGTEQGTYMVADICPGKCDSNPNDLSALDENRIVFKAHHPDYGAELWIFEHQLSTGYPPVQKTAGPIKVFPNPVQGYLNVIWPTNLRPHTIQLIGANGTEILRQSVDPEINTMHINLPGNQPGMYLIVLRAESGQLLATSKVICR